MKATMRQVNENLDGSQADNADVVIKFGKRKIYAYVGDSMQEFVNCVKRVEFSDEYFPGSSEYVIRPVHGEDNESSIREGFVIEGNDYRVWACAEYLRRVGIRGTTQKKLFVKIRR